MEASVGIRARPRAWAGLEKPNGAYLARVPAVRFTAEKLPQRLVLGTDPWRSTDPALRSAKVKASCGKKSAGTEKVHYSADEAIILQQKAQDVLPYLDGRCVYLVGMMGSGKTTVGKILAEVLGYSFFDSDKLVEKAVGISSVAEIFQLHSEAFFRDNESEVLRDLSSMHRSYMKKGLTVWLDVPLDALARRIAAVGTASRPLLHQESGDPYAKAYAKLTSLFEQRMDSYANADARVSLEHIALKQGHNDVSILTPSTIAIEALLKMENFLTEKAMVRN
ncbi:Shikimate kinase 3, chloroplastic [Dichanthelium oligosanthes]|uniref:Shikimate kinase 3, chloroplastic n=1 Tax=Dichanthelium oligosanthes TaxID=888268 RepID=A0A1E5VB70_9POAL|nr:Shikimate kinase 3, chloroplastic [Dichanthelium oligosanthes]